MSCFKSQLKNIDYPRAFEGLNSYRSIYPLRGKGYAEAFIYSNIEKYFKLQDIIKL